SMPVESQPVQQTIRIVAVHDVFSHAHITYLERTKMRLTEDHTFTCQRAKQGFSDVAGHSVQTPGAIAAREHLMLVIVIIGQIHLAGPRRRAVAKYLGENTDFESPISG